MLTFVEALSLAGDRTKQNDDACGFARDCAWVIDGATDLDDASLSGAASDASWIAHFANAYLHAHAPDADLRALFANASTAARADFLRRASGPPSEAWQWPIASLLLCVQRDDQLHGLHLGDCRLLALGADGALIEAGAAAGQARSEAGLAAKQARTQAPFLDRADTIAMLRTMRSRINREDSDWTFSLDPTCAQYASAWSIKLHRPAHILLATDGFTALCDRYGAYDPAGLVRAALSNGLHELGRELRAIEAADVDNVRHPRFKPSDDATALLMRFS